MPDTVIRVEPSCLDPGSEVMQYLIMIEKSETRYSAYSPDLMRYVSTGDTLKSVEESMREAVQFHLAGLKLKDIEIPPSATVSAYIEVAG